MVRCPSKGKRTGVRAAWKCRPAVPRADRLARGNVPVGGRKGRKKPSNDHAHDAKRAKKTADRNGRRWVMGAMTVVGFYLAIL